MYYECILYITNSILWNWEVFITYDMYLLFILIGPFWDFLYNKNIDINVSK